MQIFEALTTFFDGAGWPYGRVENETALHLEFEGQSGTWTCYAVAREEESQCIFYSVCPVQAGDRKAEVTEYLTRANFGLVIGNFEMDWDSGAVRYKSSIGLAGEDITAPLVEELVSANLITTERYLPGIAAVAQGSVSPAQALEQAENIV
jgi:hypothetical protein